MKMMTMEIQTPLLGAKNSKRGVITKGGEDYLWKTTEQTKTPWQPSNLQDPESNCLDFCFTPTSEIGQFVHQVEEEALAIVTRNTKTYLGVAGLDEDEVRCRFMSSLKSSARGAPNFKTRGRIGHLRFWDGDGQSLKDMTVFASDARYQFVVRVSSLWISQKGNFGLSFDLQHLQVYQERCPFKA
jgi:hypothetical protein